MDENQKRLDALKKKLKFSEKKKRLAELTSESMGDSVWKDWQKGQDISKEINNLKKELDELELLELLLDSEDAVEFESLYRKLELKAFLAGPHDSSPAILSIHAGQGGTEACDWASMLERMYLRYAENKGFKSELIDKTPGEETGIKSVTYEIDGDFAFGLLKGEAGVHRLVRLSPFNASNLRQTSFALVEVLPVIENDTEVEIKPDEIEFEAHRSSGHGGQNVNKVSTAVRIRHLPSGIVVDCQTERYQARNKELAMRVLRSKLFALKEKDRENLKKELKGEHKNAGWGNQIRNYVLHPYKLVKDLRTDLESSNPDSVLDGHIDDFIEAKLRL